MLTGRRADDPEALTDAGTDSAPSSAQPLHPLPLVHALPDVPLRVRPLPDAAGWAAWLCAIDIPVRADTAAALEAMRANEDAVDANSLGELIATDPLMTLKLLVHACAHRPARVVTDPATVIGELVMMGIAPFFCAFGAQACIEDRLAAPGAEVPFPAADGPAVSLSSDDDPAALAGLRRALEQARRTAGFARAFAVQRADHHAAAIHLAALLHDFAELLLWCHAPVLAQRIAELQRVDPGLPVTTVQRVVLNAELPDIQQALAQAWRLPQPLARRVADDRHADQPSVRAMTLAVRLAHRPRGHWDDAAAEGDIRDVASLLGLSAAATAALLHEIDG